MDTKGTIGVTVKEIRELGFSVDSSAHVKSEDDFTCKYSTTFRFNASDDTLTFALEVNFRDAKAQSVFLSARSYTTFTIRNLREYIAIIDGKQTFKLPLEFMASLFGMAFSHTRALLATRVAGTNLQLCIVPLIDPQIAFRNLINRTWNMPNAGNWSAD